MQSPPLEHLEALTEYPWDNEESPKKLHEAVITNSTDNNSSNGAANNQAGIYSESASDAAKRRFAVSALQMNTKTSQ